MDFGKCSSFSDMPSMNVGTINFINKVHAKSPMEVCEEPADHDGAINVDVDLREIYFLIMHFLSAGPCQKSFGKLWDELLEHDLLPRRYHAWFSRSGAVIGDESDDGNSVPLNYDNLVGRYSHVEKDHLVKLFKQVILTQCLPLRCMVGRTAPSATDVPTLLGTGSFSLLPCDKFNVNKQVRDLPTYFRWPHMVADQVRGLSLREIGGGFSKHHRAPSIRFACYAIAKPSTMVQKMQNIKKLRGHRDAVYCAIFDRSGRYVITGSDDRLVKIWSMETAFCLASCRGHEGDITDLTVSSNNALVASASNDYSIRVWRLPDGMPISVLRGHTGAVTTIAFSPRTNTAFQLLSSSDDGTCRIWDARYSQWSPRVYLPKPADATAGKNTAFPSATASTSSSNTFPCHQILCCSYNANGTVFVTGSSDTFARVWNACKPSTDDPEQPSHEIDILAGHENDVNYVQFSGCAVASHSSSSDSFSEDKISKFKNSWFGHNNIVTCSRDGSAIIWIPRSLRFHGKTGRWIRAYHLKVPPPPMPPQPPRGGPRQRFLPTPRGVNMIVWSLDNRFVLAAIMDNRICVWNANDGSLVHSLAGHTASTYVLDVHPFNPRIAMSAGYDGKTIVWDIWEGTPIRVYDIGGRFKLVDGRFSQDGTSIVLSDDVGQIYLLNTGQGESQKDAKYDQFFLGDYRPLTQDAHGNVVDQETQLSSYRRNLQDPLCDSSMLPYPEPYQSMYQQLRLGALGIEWHPSSMKFAVGTDIGMGQQFHILPLADLDVQDPLPDFLDAMYWEPENDGMNDDNDSEYNVAEEYFSDEQDCPSDSTSIESDRSEDRMKRNEKDNLARSKRKRSVQDVPLFASSGKIAAKKISDDQNGTSSRIKKYKKSKTSQRTSRRKFPTSKLLRPQRIAARNAINIFSHMSEVSTEGEDDGSEGDSSNNESSFEASAFRSKEQNEKMKHSTVEKISSDGSKDVVRPVRGLQSETGVERKKKLVVKFSLRDPPTPALSESQKEQFKSQTSLPSLAARVCEQNMEDKGVSLGSTDIRSSFGRMGDMEPYDVHNHRRLIDVEKPAQADGNLEQSCSEACISWGKIKIRTSNRTASEDLLPADVNVAKNNESLPMEVTDKSSLLVMSPLHAHQLVNSDSRVLNCQYCVEGQKDSSGSHLCVSNNLNVIATDSSSESQRNTEVKLTILKMKTKNILGDFPKLTCKTNLDDSSGAAISKKPFSVEEKCEYGVSMAANSPEEPNHMPEKGLLAEEKPEYGVSMAGSSPDEPNHMSQFLVDGDEICDNDSNFSLSNHDLETEFHDMETDSTRRSRTFRLKATSRETNPESHHLRMFDDPVRPDTSIGAQKSSKKALDYFPSEGSQRTAKSRSSRNKREGYLKEGNRDVILNKQNWLLLSKKEAAYRYIPQLGDKVVYLRQGHQGYMKLSKQSLPGPWCWYGDNIRAVEICLVEELKYATRSGSGDSCCELMLKFIDTSCNVVGQKFCLVLPELDNFPDFIVEWTWYDVALDRSWTIGDECQVWWRDEENGAWWDGRIVGIKDKSSEFPGSPWERFNVEYKCDPTDSHFHCPWELHDRGRSWEQPNINFKCCEKILNSLTELLRAARKDKDRYGVLKLNDVAQKSDFVNRFPVPLSPRIIKLRLENNYYRSLKATKHDFEVMLSNAESYLQRNKELLGKMKLLSSWFNRVLSNV